MWWQGDVLRETEIRQGELCPLRCACADRRRPSGTDKRVLECLQKSLRIATSTIDEISSVRALRRCPRQVGRVLRPRLTADMWYFFEQACSAVSPKYVNSLVELITGNIDNVMSATGGGAVSDARGGGPGKLGLVDVGGGEGVAKVSEDLRNTVLPYPETRKSKLFSSILSKPQPPANPQHFRNTLSYMRTRQTQASSAEPPEQPEGFRGRHQASLDRSEHPRGADKDEHDLMHVAIDLVQEPASKSKEKVPHPRRVQRAKASDQKNTPNIQASVEQVHEIPYSSRLRDRFKHSKLPRNRSERLLTHTGRRRRSQG